jgi:hypothetical protein
MRVDLSNRGVRTCIQTTFSCEGRNVFVVSVEEKARKTSQVWVVETNASELLMKCRKNNPLARTSFVHAYCKWGDGLLDSRQVKDFINYEIGFM